MTAGEIATGVQAGQAIADEILLVIESVDPGVAPDAATAQKLTDLFAQYAATALNGWQATSGLPINPTTIAAFMPNDAELSLPDQDPPISGTVPQAPAQTGGGN